MYYWIDLYFLSPLNSKGPVLKPQITLNKFGKFEKRNKKLVMVLIVE
jgi:hypothetical protein